MSSAPPGVTVTASSSVPCNSLPKKAGAPSSICTRPPRDFLWSRQGTAENRSEEHTSELQSLMRISYAVFCLKKKKKVNLQHIAKPKESSSRHTTSTNKK